MTADLKTAGLQWYDTFATLVRKGQGSEVEVVEEVEVEVEVEDKVEENKEAGDTSREQEGLRWQDVCTWKSENLNFDSVMMLRRSQV